MPRSLATRQEDIQNIELHAFSDASGKGVAAAVYAVAVQETGVNQGLIMSRARLEGTNDPTSRVGVRPHGSKSPDKRECSVRRISHNCEVLLARQHVALHWIRRPGEYKQFVSNRVEKIQAHSEVVWCHVRTSDNPADIGSCSREVSSHALWWNGPERLINKACWPPDIVTSASKESLGEAKVKQDFFAVAVADEQDALLEKFSYWKTIRVSARIMRFAQRRQRSWGTTNDGRDKQGGALLGEASTGTRYSDTKKICCN